MTEIEILRKQIEELEKLLTLKDMRIVELERKSMTFQQYTQQYFPIQECQHEYSAQFGQTTNPCCKKCGKMLIDFSKFTNCS